MSYRFLKSASSIISIESLIYGCIWLIVLLRPFELVFMFDLLSVPWAERRIEISYERVLSVCPRTPPRLPEHGCRVVWCLVSCTIWHYQWPFFGSLGDVWLEFSLSGIKITALDVLKNVLKLILRKRKRERHIKCCSTFLCIPWLMLVCALTWDRTHNLGVLGRRSNQRSHPARAALFLSVFVFMPLLILLLLTILKRLVWWLSLECRIKLGFAWDLN